LGYIFVKDRQGREVKAPLMSISIAIVNNKISKINNIIELTEIASEIKKYLKMKIGSKFLRNRRIRNKLPLNKDSIPERIRYRASFVRQETDIMPLGQLLIKAKLISEEQLTEALFEHWNSRQMLGQTLIKLGMINEHDLDVVLKDIRLNRGLTDSHL